MFRFKFRQLAMLIRLASIIIFNFFIVESVLPQSGIELQSCMLDGKVTLFAPQSDYGYDWILSGETTSSIRINKDMIGQEVVCVVERNKKCDCDCEQKDCGTEKFSYRRLISKSDFKKIDFNFQVKNLSCNEAQDGEILFKDNQNPEYQFYWSDGSRETSRKGLNAGKYSVTISKNDCQVVSTFKVQEPKKVENIEIDINNPTCFGGNDGSVLIRSKDQSEIFVVEWHNGQKDNELRNISAGEYGVKIKKGENCSYQQIKIDNPASIKSKAVVHSNYNGSAISCFGEKNGAIKINISKGVPPFSLQWNNQGNFDSISSNSTIISNLKSGLYKFKVRDAKGCIDEQQVFLAEPDPIQTKILKSNFNGYQVKCYLDSNAYIKPIVAGGTGEYNFEWSNKNGFISNSEILNNLKSGKYKLKISDSNGCFFTEEIIMKSPEKVKLLAHVLHEKKGRKKLVKLKPKGGTGQYVLNDQIKLDKAYKVNISKLSQFVLVDSNGCTTKRKIKLSSKMRKKNKNNFFNIFLPKKKKYKNAKCPRF